MHVSVSLSSAAALELITPYNLASAHGIYLARAKYNGRCGFISASNDRYKFTQVRTCVILLEATTQKKQTKKLAMPGDNSHSQGGCC